MEVGERNLSTATVHDTVTHCNKDVAADRVSWHFYLWVVLLPQEWVNLQTGLNSLLCLYLSGMNPNLPSKKVYPQTIAKELMHLIKLFPSSERTSWGWGLAPRLLLWPLSPGSSFPWPWLLMCPAERAVCSSFPMLSQSLYVLAWEKNGWSYEKRMAGAMREMCLGQLITCALHCFWPWNELVKAEELSTCFPSFPFPVP